MDVLERLSDTRLAQGKHQGQERLEREHVGELHDGRAGSCRRREDDEGKEQK